jgi:hypothetical protein
MIDKMREMVGILKGVQDEASAKAANPKLKALRKELDELKVKSDKLGPASEETQKRVNDKHEKEAQELTSQMMAEMMRIGMDRKLAPHIDVFSGS